MQTSASVIPKAKRSLSAYGPKWVIIPAATKIDINIDCQKLKNRIPLIQRNLGTGLSRPKIVSSQTLMYEERNSVNGTKKCAPERLKIVIDTNPEQSEAIEAQTDAEVVYQANIEISRFCTKVSFIVCTSSFENHGHEGKDGFNLYVFWRK